MTSGPDSDQPISFGDRVRVTETEETRRLGFAGLIGVVYGESVPSASGVANIVGPTTEDFAYNFGSRTLIRTDGSIQACSRSLITSVQLR